MHNVGPLDVGSIVDHKWPLHITGPPAAAGHHYSAARPGDFNAPCAIGSVVNHRSTRCVDFADATIRTLDDTPAVGGVDDIGRRSWTSGILTELTTTRAIVRLTLPRRAGTIALPRRAATIALPRRHPLTLDATVALPRRRALTLDATIALPGRRTLTLDATIALPGRHTLTLAHSIALPRRGALTLNATIALPRRRALTLDATIALPRRHALTCGLARVLALDSLALCRLLAGTLTRDLSLALGLRSRTILLRGGARSLGSRLRRAGRRLSLARLRRRLARGSRLTGSRRTRLILLPVSRRGGREQQRNHCCPKPSG
jgi:hypothetical protein